jgi:peptide/nickel transport system substrate-binding protein
MGYNNSREPVTGRSPLLSPTTMTRRTMTRRQLLQRGGLLGLLAASPALLSACTVADDSGTPGEKPTAGGDALALRLVADIQNLDPAFMVGATDDAVMLCVAENLVTYRPGSTELVNELAEELTSSDDGLSHTFRIKEGIQFHKGYGEVTAEDVKFSFERIAGLTKPDLESPYQGDWAALKEVEVTGTYTGVIRLKEPFAPLFLTTLPGSSGIIVSRKAYEKLGKKFATNPVGTGPYEFTKWTRGQEVILSRFDDWGGAAKEWSGEPEWKELRLRAIPDDSAADIAVQTGEVGLGPIPYTSVKRFSDDSEFTITKQTTLDYGWVGFNVTDPVLSDVRVRRAIRQALDVDSMIEAAFDGQTTRAKALIAPDMPIGYWADAPQYDPDAAAAKAMLDEAGVKDLKLEMSIAEEAGANAIAQIVQANLADIGITVSIKKRDAGEMQEQVKSLQLFYTSFSNQADPSWATVWFTGDQVGEWNFMSWSNKEFDRLNKAAMVEMDSERRSDMYVQMQKIMDEEAVAAWVMYRTLHYAHAPELEPSLITPRYGKYRPWATKQA